MTHYELHRLDDDRWQLDAIFDDRMTAIEEGRSQMTRARTVAAVRVLKVEEHEKTFVEWIVYDREANSPRTPSRRFAPLPRDREPRFVRRRVSAGMSPLYAAREPSSIWALVTLFALGALLVVLAQWLEPKEVWLFDREQAHAPHTLRNPWTGEASR
jgi:hypothetical protein